MSIQAQSCESNRNRRLSLRGFFSDREVVEVVRVSWGEFVSPVAILTRFFNPLIHAELHQGRESLSDALESSA